jgi:hypothetical protein
MYIGEQDMQTVSKDKLKKAARLMELVQTRREIEKEETELKDYFRDTIRDGVLEAGSIIILVETKRRETLDRDALKTALGERLNEFVRVTEYEQVICKDRKAA